MIKKLGAFILLFAISLSAISQSTETKKTGARPDIPGTFTIELGLNRALSAPSAFKLGLWGSRTVNVYYQYEMRILKSHFSFVPGIGLSLERFKFRSGHILSLSKEDDVYFGPVANSDSVVLYPVTTHKLYSLRKSQFINNYVEVPLELKYTLNPDDPSRSFKISIGGRVGYMYDAYTKIKYKQEGEIKQIKDKQNFNLTRFRYGAFAKIGFGSFSLFGYYNLTPLFKKDKGFYEAGLPNNSMNTMTVGISLSSF